MLFLLRLILPDGLFALTLFATDSPSSVRFGGGAMEPKTNISPSSVCIPAIANQSRADNALLINQILWE
jgi:hypothetical protein